jgi:hypothetical protein
VKIIFSPVLSDIKSSIPLLEVSQDFPTFPPDRSSIKMKMSMEHWWNDTDRGKPK